MTWVGTLAIMFLISLAGSLLVLVPFRILAMFVGHGELIWIILMLLVIDSTSTVMDLLSKNVEKGKVRKMSLGETLEILFSNKDIVALGCVAIWVKVLVVFALGYLITETYGLVLGTLSVIAFTVIDDLIGRKTKYGIANSVFAFLLRIKRVKAKHIKRPVQLFASILVNKDVTAT